MILVGDIMAMIESKKKKNIMAMISDLLFDVFSHCFASSFSLHSYLKIGFSPNEFQLFE